MGHGKEKTPTQLAVLKTLRCFSLTLIFCCYLRNKNGSPGVHGIRLSLSEAPSKQLLPLENRPEFLSDRKLKGTRGYLKTCVSLCFGAEIYTQIMLMFLQIKSNTCTVMHHRIVFPFPHVCMFRFCLLSFRRFITVSLSIEFRYVKIKEWCNTPRRKSLSPSESNSDFNES